MQGASHVGSMHTIFLGTYGANKKTWQSFDVIAHETTHAVLDHLFPALQQNKYQKAVGEALADITPMILWLALPISGDLAFRALKLAPGEKSFLTEFAEGLSNSDHDADGVRSALNRIVAPSNHYELGQNLTWQFYSNLSHVAMKYDDYPSCWNTIEKLILRYVETLRKGAAFGAVEYLNLIK